MRFFRSTVIRLSGALRGLSLALLLAGLCSAHTSRADSPAPTQYEVKAAFLFNFAKFVEWPPSKFDSPQSPFIIGILGDDPFGGDLEKTIRGKMVNGRPFEIRREKAERQLLSCHIVFIASSERRRMDRIKETFAGRSVLMVGDFEGFLESGGMINFLLDGDRVRFEINPRLAEQEKLKLSSKLLTVATRRLNL